MGTTGSVLQASSPAVTQVYLADTDTLVVEIVQGKVNNLGQEGYDPVEGDTIRRSEDDLVLSYNGEGAIGNWPKNAEVRRSVNGQITTVGYLLEGPDILALKDTGEGDPLNVTLAMDTASYSLAIQGDPAVTEQPVSVERKSKPLENGKNDGGMSIRHRLYLKFSSPLSWTRAYQLNISPLGLDQEVVSFNIQRDRQWTEVLHVNQVGYHPEDTFKQATLSLWKGTGGAHDYDNWIGKSFHLVDEFTHKTVFTGQIQKLQDETDIDVAFSNGRNNTAAPVYGLDFSAFSETGRFRVLVPGLGISYPFPITSSAWGEAFQISMMGLLHHRSGIELGPPFTPYERPLTFHPDMGVKVLQTDVTILEGESSAIEESLTRLYETADEVPEAWGGYMDAGDWDRRTQHLAATYGLLEIFDLYPDFFESLTLALPENEVTNTIPDILDEALWNVEFYQRLQREDGGVRGGVESTAHPRNGEGSWQETLLVGAYDVDALSTFRFASSAAKLSRLLAPYDESRATTLREDSIRAYTWGVDNADATVNRLPDSDQSNARDNITQAQAVAAVELYHLTGTNAYHDDALSILDPLGSSLSFGDNHRDSVFAYAALPSNLANTSLQDRAVEYFIEAADKALNLQSGNPHGIAPFNEFIPMMGFVGYFSVPQMISRSLPRAYALTGDTRYRNGALAACNFPNGANPDNLCYTTGIGAFYPTAPLHIDSRVTGQPVPAGITIYGPSDPANETFTFNDWVHTWRLSFNQNMVPDSRTWPAAESHVNIFDWPSMSEYTIHQTIGPTAIYWGYLAGSSGSAPGLEKGVGKDEDGDGLEDSVEYAIIEADPDDRFTTLEQVLPWRDYDVDGLTNFEEMIQDSHPAIPGMGTIALGNDTQTFLIAMFQQGEKGPFQFMVSSDLNIWTPVGVPFDSMGDLHQTDLSGMASDTVFVRVEKTGD